MSIQATGDIRKYQIFESIFTILNLPLALLILWLGYNPSYVLIIKFVLYIVTFAWSLFFLRGRIKLPVIKYFHEVIIPVLIITIVSCSLTLFIFYLSNSHFIISCIVSTISIICLVYCFGFSKQERIQIRNMIRENISGI